VVLYVIGIVCNGAKFIIRYIQKSVLHSHESSGRPVRDLRRNAIGFGFDADRSAAGMNFAKKSLYK
jgi:hypothetical protein